MRFARALCRCDGRRAGIERLAPVAASPIPSDRIHAVLVMRSPARQLPSLMPDRTSVGRFRLPLVVFAPTGICAGAPKSGRAPGRCRSPLSSADLQRVAQRRPSRERANSLGASQVRAGHGAKALVVSAHGDFSLSNESCGATPCPYGGAQGWARP